MFERFFLPRGEPTLKKPPPQQGLLSALLKGFTSRGSFVAGGSLECYDQKPFLKQALSTHSVSNKALTFIIP